jgi:hypothetical protein
MSRQFSDGLRQGCVGDEDGQGADAPVPNGEAGLRAVALQGLGAADAVGWPGARCPTQAWCWLEWESSTTGQSRPAARSRFLAIHSDSISTRPSAPVA